MVGVMRGFPWLHRVVAPLALLAVGLGEQGAAAAAPALAPVARPAQCDSPVYLTFDTGHMGVAPLIADVLAREGVRVTFFLANERTQTGGGSLDAHWAPWWQARAREGHVFGSHTHDHVYWRADRSDGRFEVRPTFGPDAGRTLTWSPRQYCDELQRSAQRFREMTGQPMAPLFRAPGGKTSKALLAAAKDCGWHHVPWTPAGFLGDELSSDRASNAQLLRQSLERIQAGDILLAHLGIWSRQEAWAPGVLEPLIQGLKRKGLCFVTLAEHPQWRDALRWEH